MLLNLVEYHWAEHIDDALLLLARLDTKTVPLAGGTYLLGLQDESIQAVVDLRELGLSYIAENAQSIRIGAMTTLQDIVAAPILKNSTLSVVAQAALASSSSRLIRNCATLGGTLGAGVAAQSDLLTALVALDAWAVVRSGSKTQVNVGGSSSSGVVFKGKQERRLSCSTISMEKRANELIVEVVIPRPSGNSGATFLRIGRTATDIALLNVVTLVEVEGGLYKKVRVAVGAANSEATRIQTVEQQLEGKPVLNARDPATMQAFIEALKMGMSSFRPEGDYLATNGYRRVSGINLVYHALEEATQIACWRTVVTTEDPSPSVGTTFTASATVTKGDV